MEPKLAPFLFFVNLYMAHLFSIHLMNHYYSLFISNDHSFILTINDINVIIIITYNLKIEECNFL